MNHTSRSAVILLFVFNVKAQNNDYSQHSVRPIHPSLAVVFGVLSILFSITFLLLAYAKFCLATVYGESNDEEIIPQEILQPGSRFSGIDRKLVESLPFFKFSSLKGPKEGLECAICLSKFQDNETLRLMPKCRHSFHTNCIDKWLESHSSCPICRDRFEADDLTNFPCTNSLRYFANSFNQLEEQNVLFFVEREENRSHNTRSSRFNTMVGSLRRLSLGWIAEQLLQKDLDSNQSGNLLHKFRHRIIVSDLICKSRWSDLNSSDLTFLNSEMLNYLSSRRFSPVKSQSFHGQMRMDEDILNIKEDIERKRLFESRVGKITSDSAITAISPKILDSFVQDQEPSSSLLNPAEKRAMSEIVYLPRRTNCIARSRNIEPLSRNERIRRLWLPIARSTVQWYNGRESALDFKKSPINV